MIEKSFMRLACAMASCMMMASASAGDAIPLNWPIPEVPKDANSATFARPCNDWMQKFERNCARTKAGPVDLLFLGDSITEGWRGSPVWNEFYGKLNAAPYGISGDHTENLIWRIQNGEIDGLSPKLIVILIGTNNFGFNTSAQIAEGVMAVADEAKKRCPGSTILIMGVFPRGEKASDPVRAKVAEINKLLAESSASRPVKFMDIGKAFLSQDGSISKELMYDFLHPSAKGQRVWAEQIQPEVSKALGSQAILK